jgi:hypothetical protein
LQNKYSTGLKKAALLAFALSRSRDVEYNDGGCSFEQTVSICLPMIAALSLARTMGWVVAAAYKAALPGDDCRAIARKDFG